MFEFDAASLTFVCAWSLAAVGVGLACGFFIGRTFTLTYEPTRLRKDRERTLRAVVNLMDSTQQLNDDVDVHNTALASAQKDLSDIDPVRMMQEGGKIGSEVQNQLLEHIQRVVDANRRLESDLSKSRFELENQAHELDRTRKEARTDALCKVGNRKAFDETLNYLIKRLEFNQESFGLMLIDVDHFKRINDTFGHKAGDQVLISIGSALKECVRPEDYVARLGGDEFAILLHGLTSQNARSVGDRIRSTIELYDFCVGDEKGSSTVVTLSMGLAVARTKDTYGLLYDRADKALYRSKSLGRNRLHTDVGDCKSETDRQIIGAAVTDTENAQVFNEHAVS